MSVKEAREDVRVEAAAAVWLAIEGLKPTTDDLDAAIDRLILEVQAEMPCYWECESQVAGTELATTRRDEVLWCPSCTARAKRDEGEP